MKQFKCEMCGNSDLVKREDIYVCRFCGAKYKNENEKKLMIEGKIDVSGSTIKLDTSDELYNLYQLARRAKAEENTESAERYYDMILLKDPNSWEAAFYVIYYRALRCTIAGIGSAATSVCNCINNIIYLVKNYVKDKNEQRSAVNEVADRCTTIATLLLETTKKYYQSLNGKATTNYSDTMKSNCMTTAEIMYTLGDSIAEYFDDNEALHITAANAWKDGIKKHNSIMIYILQGKQEQKTLMLKYADKIKKYDASYETPKISTSLFGCYIATAVYGSYDCPQVWTLRRYRDNVLAQTWYGRIFIRSYYAISPTLVKWFGHTEWFKRIWRGRLDKMIEKLQMEGFECTPYMDRDWQQNE